MIDIQKIFNRSKPTSVLALTISSERVEFALVDTSSGSARVEKTGHLDLAPNQIAEFPETCGLKIKEAIAQQEISETQCVVCLPLSWLLVARIDLPDITGEDLESFVELQVEQEFPFPPADLLWTYETPKTDSKNSSGVLVAIQRKRLSQIQSALGEAGLKIVSISPAIANLPLPGINEDGVIDLLASSDGIELRTANSAGSLGFRPVERESAAQVMGREIRITLGQMPEKLRATFGTVRVFGTNGSSDKLVKEFGAQLKPLGLSVNLGRESYSRSVQVSTSVTPVGPSTMIGGQVWLQEQAAPFELLPPKVSKLQVLVQRFLEGKSKSWGIAAATVAALALIAFLIQGSTASRLKSEWDAMAPKVLELEDLQANIRQFRPWYDQSIPSLTILSEVASAFPESGTVWLKTLEIKEQTKISGGGSARDEEAFLNLQETLRTNPAFGDVNFQNIVQNTRPIQFTFRFDWKGVQPSNE